MTNTEKRSEFEEKALHYANTVDPHKKEIFFNAGRLGILQLSWIKFRWFETWIDKKDFVTMKQLKGLK